MGHYGPPLRVGPPFQSSVEVRHRVLFTRSDRCRERDVQPGADREPRWVRRCFRCLRNELLPMCPECMICSGHYGVQPDLRHPVDIRPLQLTTAETIRSADARSRAAVLSHCCMPSSRHVTRRPDRLRADAVRIRVIDSHFDGNISSMPRSYAREPGDVIGHFHPALRLQSERVDVRWCCAQNVDSSRTQFNCEHLVEHHEPTNGPSTPP